MKRFVSIIITNLLIIMLFSSCAKQEEKAERIIISVSDTQASFIKDPNKLSNVISDSEFIVLATITKVNDGYYDEKDAEVLTAPYFINTMKIEKVFTGNVEKGDIIDFYWNSGYVKYKDYLENGYMIQKSFENIDYEKYKDNGNAYIEMHSVGLPIMQENEQYIVFISPFREGYGAKNAIGIRDGKSFNSLICDDGTSYEDIEKDIFSILDIN